MGTGVQVGVRYKPLSIKDTRELKLGDEVYPMVSLSHHFPAYEPCTFAGIADKAIDERGEPYLLILVEKLVGGKTELEVGRQYYFGKS